MGILEIYTGFNHNVLYSLKFQEYFDFGGFFPGRKTEKESSKFNEGVRYLCRFSKRQFGCNMQLYPKRDF